MHGIGAHFAGVDHSYKVLNRVQAKCLYCGQFSECEIRCYEEYLHIFFKKVKLLNRHFWFDWKKCDHRVVMANPKDVERYQQEQVETGMLSIPYYQEMDLQFTRVPHVKLITIIVQSGLVLLLIFLGILLLKALGLDLPAWLIGP